jgi:hypothetical protein
MHAESSWCRCMHAQPPYPCLCHASHHHINHLCSPPACMRCKFCHPDRAQGCCLLRMQCCYKCNVGPATSWRYRYLYASCSLGLHSEELAGMPVLPPHTHTHKAPRGLSCVPTHSCVCVLGRSLKPVDCSRVWRSCPGHSGPALSLPAEFACVSESVQQGC